MPMQSSRSKTPLPGRLDAAPWPVMVLAYNEELHIVECLDSIFAADPSRRFEIFVMANGCTDRTEELVEEYSRRRPEVHLVSIAMGDKCNAWNIFIHETVPSLCAGRDVYFFMDGDATAASGTFTAMAMALATNTSANAASAVPFSGRNAARDRQKMLEEHALVANLYSLRGSFVDRLRAQGVRIPLKLEGDDGLIGAFVKWDLKPESNGTDDRRIVVCSDAGFEFKIFTPLRPRDWKTYWKRCVRYGRRNYEFRLLGPLLESKGIVAMPIDITELYPKAENLPLRWQGIYTLTNWVALRHMRQIGRQRAG